MDFWKISPGGNPTILVPAAQVEAEQRAACAATLLHPDHIGADQVGFYSLPTGKLPRLEMMGNEFCLNASRALAWLLTRLGEKELDSHFKMEVSGLRQPALCLVEPNNRTWIAMDFKAFPEPTQLRHDLYLIRLPGISHLIFLNQPMPEQPGAAEQICQKLLSDYNLEQNSATGCIWLDAGKPALQPLVWVRNTKSLIRESACGSGSLACALMLDQLSRQNEFVLGQPSGIDLQIRLEHGRGACRAWVGGQVMPVARGEFYL